MPGGQYFGKKLNIALFRIFSGGRLTGQNRVFEAILGVLGAVRAALGGRGG
jgi:hypothetical protein